jgi:hydroxymethylbilane synthase
MKKIRIGSRTSKMAMTQTHRIIDELIRHHPVMAEEGCIEIVPIKTTGCTVQDRKLSEIGGKGLFIKELEIALERGDIDIAMHSVKDVPSIMPEGFELAVILERDEPWDCFLSPIAKTLDDLPQGATIGTSSPRRDALTRAYRPDLEIVMFRGNADTRIQKMENGEVDGTYLALSGLTRIGMEDKANQILGPDIMLPACGQGALCIEILSNNTEMRNLLMPLNHEASYRCVMAERHCLAEVDGDCHTPIAAYAEYDGKKLITLTALASRVDGSEIIRHTMTAPAESYIALGKEVGRTIKDQMSDDFFDIAA